VSRLTDILINYLASFSVDCLYYIYSKYFCSSGDGWYFSRRKIRLRAGRSRTWGSIAGLGKITTFFFQNKELKQIIVVAVIIIIIIIID
jgi:hypothetical protein